MLDNVAKIIFLEPKDEIDSILSDTLEKKKYTLERIKEEDEIYKILKNDLSETIAIIIDSDTDKNKELIEKIRKTVKKHVPLIFFLPKEESLKDLSKKLNQEIETIIDSFNEKDNVIAIKPEIPAIETIDIIPTEDTPPKLIDSVEEKKNVIESVLTPPPPPSKKVEVKEIEEHFDNVYFFKKPINQNHIINLLDNLKTLKESFFKASYFLNEEQDTLNQIDYLKTSVQNITEAKKVANFISLFFPDPTSAEKGICELLFNSIMHGNLEIGFKLKNELSKDGKLKEEIITRLKSKEHKKKVVNLVYEKKEDGHYLQITDTGKGFDWKKYLQVDPSRAPQNHGRGIALCNRIYFDKVAYNKEGNQVTIFKSKKKRPRNTYWE